MTATDDADLSCRARDAGCVRCIALSWCQVVCLPTSSSVFRDNVDTYLFVRAKFHGLRLVAKAELPRSGINRFKRLDFM